jgi:hypothetical protein
MSKSAFNDFRKSIDWKKVLKKGSSTPHGHRLFPSRTPKQDAAYNYRADKGADIGNGKFEVIIQANKNAENKAVRDAANKDSHAIHAKAVADPANDPQGSKVDEELFADWAARKK